MINLNGGVLYNEIMLDSSLCYKKIDSKMLTSTIEKFSEYLNQLKNRRSEIDYDISQCELVIKSLNSYKKTESEKVI